MKRRLILGVVGAMAASVFVAPAANAQIAACTIGKMPQQTIVSNSGGELNVYPANVVPYTTTLAGYVTGVATCIVNETAGPAVTCAKAFVNNRPTVTVDPQTLQITVEYGDFLGTTCTLSS